MGTSRGPHTPEGLTTTRPPTADRTLRDRSTTTTTPVPNHHLSEMPSARFQDEHAFEKRQSEASRIRSKYPNRIPVICERADKSDIADIDKKKYLVPSDLTVGQFVYVIRKRIKLSSEKAIFIFCNNSMPPTGAMMSHIYDQNKDDDGFLYITYSGENTFG